jgi:hypothetical protein
MYTYPGNIHIHSAYSDGSSNIPDIAAEAAKAGLSYIVITDHETLDGLHEEGFSSGVAVLVGMEINRLHSHYLALGIQTVIKANTLNPQEVINSVRHAGGLGIIAHPFEKGSRYIEKGRAYPWKHWPVFGFNGLEIWNYSSHWRGLHPSMFKTLYWFLFNRPAAMNGPSPEILQLWDCYNIHGHRVVAIGGSDAHATRYRLGSLPVTLFTYRYIFSTINTYIVTSAELSSDYNLAAKQVLSALRSGSCYISFDSLNPGKGFSFQACDRQKVYQMGGFAPLSKQLTFSIKSPPGRPQIRLVHNGKVVFTKKAADLEYPVTDPGLYRIEIFYCPLIGQPRPWIYSNPIYISSEVALSADLL